MTTAARCGPPLLLGEGLFCGFGWLIADCYRLKNQPVPFFTLLVDCHIHMKVVVEQIFRTSENFLVRIVVFCLPNDYGSFKVERVRVTFYVVWVFCDNGGETSTHTILDSHLAQGIRRVLDNEYARVFFPVHLHDEGPAVYYFVEFRYEGFLVILREFATRHKAFGGDSEIHKDPGVGRTEVLVLEMDLLEVVLDHRHLETRRVHAKGQVYGGGGGGRRPRHGYACLRWACRPVPA